MARTAVTITANGNAQVDTAQKKFGTGSYLGDGTGDFLSGTLGTAPGTQDFTIEGWVRMASFKDYDTFFGTTRGTTGFNCGTDSLKVFTIYSTDSGRIFEVNNAFPSTNTWYHWAITRSGTTLRGFVDGTKIAEVSDSHNWSQTAFRIGDLVPGGGESINGWLDEIRLSVGIARWTADFTPETSAYSCGDDGYTKLLVHCDGTDASTTFTDDNSECVTSTPPTSSLLTLGVG